jgi:Cu/Ag efflux protein CusF
VPDGAKVQKLAPGSTDLKTATASQLSDVAVGDRILASVRAGDTPDTFTARTVVLMKSGDIAQANAAEQADWRRNGVGGIVASVDPSGTITVTSGAKKIAVSTSPKTDYRRFSGDSTEYKDAKPGTLAEIHTGDQIQARGVKAEDGLSVQASQVVSGSFKNLSGQIGNIDAASGKITLKDLASKKTYTVTVSANSNLRALPPQMASMFASRGSGAAGRGEAGTAAPAQGAASGSQAGPGSPGGSSGGQGGPGGGMRRNGGGGGDLSQMISRLPTTSLSNLKNGDAVLIVASEPSPGSTNVTAITLLTGVEPILTANPNGGVNLGGWSMGGGAPSE